MREKSGVTIDNFDFYLCFGIFRIGVIIQQIYYRYYHGQTKDERFSAIIFGVHIAGQIAQGIIRESSL